MILNWPFPQFCSEACDEDAFNDSEGSKFILLRGEENMSSLFIRKSKSNLDPELLFWVIPVLTLDIKPDFEELVELFLSLGPLELKFKPALAYHS